MKATTTTETADYLTIDEAADLIRTPVRTLHAWSSRGTGPPVAKIGRRLLYRRDLLLGWVESHAKGAR